METKVKHDIETEADVKLMVDSFYDKVNNDELLSPVFNDVAHVNWPSHLPKMYDFWNFLLLGIAGYKGQPFPMHAKLPVSPVHFNRWLELFTKNIDEQFVGKVAELAKEKGNHIALTFQYRMGLIQ